MEVSKDYSGTVNLPKTDFPMRANLVEREPQILKLWDKLKIYKLLLKKNKSKPKFVLHDGPPYANGPIHIGHALNKILKDIIIKYKSMTGFYTPFIPGWDCHGLPIEHQLFKELGIRKQDISCLEFRKKARDYVEKFIEIQKEEFKRLGVFADWKRPYITMSAKYERVILRDFRRLFTKGYIYRRKKPVHWCFHCETALAEAEVEYEDKISPSIYVKFRVIKPSNIIKEYNKNLYVLIWTTTPWTLPANLMVVFNPRSEYSLVKCGNEFYIVGDLLCSEIFSKVGKEFEILKKFPGSKLGKNEIDDENCIVCSNPLLDKESIGVVDDSVVMDEGTGIVHSAPGHGEEDYYIGLKFNLDIFSPVSGDGRFTDEVPMLKGLKVHEANDEIIKMLDSKGLLFYRDEKLHSYPHCWRCKNPTIFRATEQWFLNIDKYNMRQNLIEAVQKVKWIPSQGVVRMTEMVKTRPDWCLSRQRYWGVPIPVVYCKNCGAYFTCKELMSNLEKMTSKRTSDVWFECGLYEFLPKDTKCEKCGSMTFYKCEDILDVWFDSGVSHSAVLVGKKEMTYPASLYLEGSDQYRGWFQTSLIPAVAIYKTAPYISVLTHGFVVDGEGRKMSKSLGNVISPQDIWQKYGAEILRLWVAVSDYREDIRLSDQILQRLVDFYRKIRNTIRFLLGNLYDFYASKNIVQYDKLWEIDKWILHKLMLLISETKKCYENYEFYRITHILNEFFVNILSNFYFDVLKDRVYTFYSDSCDRRSAQTVMFYLLDSILRLLAPILPFTIEEAYQHMKNIKEITKSVFLEDMPDINNEFINYELDEVWNKILWWRDIVNVELESARRKDLIGSSLDAKVIITTNKNDEFQFLLENSENLKMSFIVSQIEIKFDTTIPAPKVEVVHAEGEKCKRCWNYTLSPIDDVCSRCHEVLRLMK